MNNFKRTLIFLFLFLQVLMLVWSKEESLNVTAVANNQTEADAKRLFSKSFITKFSSSWKVFAKANDIAKREKLRKALTDALHSMDYKKKAEIASNIDHKTVQRIKHAATLLKQFKQMYSLSENVKRTLKVYKNAQKNITGILNDDVSADILKQFLLTHQETHKRDHISFPSSSSSQVSTVFDESVESSPDNIAEDIPIIKPQYITKTSKFSLKAALVGKKGHLGMEFASVDPKTSSINKAEKAFKAAKILLRYVGNNEKSNTSLEDQKKSTFPTKGHTRSGILEAGMSHITHLTNKSNMTDTTNDDSTFETMESLIVDEDNSKAVSKSDIASNKTDQAQESKKEIHDNLKEERNKTAPASKRFNPYVELLRKMRHKNDSSDTSLSFNAKKDETIIKPDDIRNTFSQAISEVMNNNTTSKDQNELSNNNTSTANTTISETQVKNDTVSSDSTSGVKEHSEEKTNHENNTTLPKSKTEENGVKTGMAVSNEDLNEAMLADTEERKTESKIKSLDNTILLKKQHDAIQHLQGAKIARQKYEIAKHELAEKVKELYDMANEYEKQETSDQVLEEKNKISKATSEAVEVIPKKGKRDEDHPGVALSGILHKKVKTIVTETEDESTPHHGFTMGANDRQEHQVELEDPKPSDDIKKVYDVGLPKDVKVEDGGDHRANKKSKSQEETLKVIAQAIQEDMNDISENEKEKKKLLQATLATGTSQKGVESNSTTAKKDGPKVDKIDEYLTKALADIMGNDTSSASPTKGIKPTAKVDDADKSDRNRKIVEKAMANHARNPNLPLPLVETKGEKIVLNKEDKNTKPTNDVFAHATDHPSSKTTRPAAYLDLHDPANKDLLDKASHMEEQVAAAQDKLYTSSENIKDPAPAAPNVEGDLPSIEHPTSKSNYQPAAPPPQTPTTYQRDRAHDPYGSISPDAAQAPPNGMQEEDPEGDKDDEDEDEEEPHHRRHHHGSHHDEPDDEEEQEEDDGPDVDDEEDDEDEDENDEKKSRLDYHDEMAKKRTISSTTSKVPRSQVLQANSGSAVISSKPVLSSIRGENTGLPITTGNAEVGNEIQEEKHIEELEDNTKKSFVPRPNF